MMEKFGRVLRRGDARLRLRRRLRDRVLPAPPGRQVLRPTSTPTPTCASPRRSTTTTRRRTTAATCRRRSRARRPISWSSRSPPTGASRPARSREIVRALLDNRRVVSYLEIDAPQRPRRLPARRRALLRRAARLLRQHRAMTETDRRTIARWVAPGRAGARPRLRRRLAAQHLWQTRQAPGYGVEIDDANVLACVKNDVNVLQLDLERRPRRSSPTAPSTA